MARGLSGRCTHGGATRRKLARPYSGCWRACLSCHAAREEEGPPMGDRRAVSTPRYSSAHKTSTGRRGGATVAITSAGAWKPFGRPRATGANTPNAPPWLEQYQDPTGLTHLRARQYDSAAGRFFSMDWQPPPASLEPTPTPPPIRSDTSTSRLFSCDEVLVQRATQRFSSLSSSRGIHAQPIRSSRACAHPQRQECLVTWRETVGRIIGLS